MIDKGLMEAPETLACACGKGTIEITATVYGQWKVEKVLRSCGSCGSDDIKRAREALAEKPRK